LGGPNILRGSSFCLILRILDTRSYENNLVEYLGDVTEVAFAARRGSGKLRTLGDRASRRPQFRGFYSAVRTVIGVPFSIVRDTVQVWSCEALIARGSNVRAASPASPSGKVTSKVRVMSFRLFSPFSRT
jgi:hypothetical protein